MGGNRIVIGAQSVVGIGSKTPINLSHYYRGSGRFSTSKKSYFKRVIKIRNGKTKKNKSYLQHPLIISKIKKLFNQF